MKRNLEKIQGRKENGNRGTEGAANEGFMRPIALHAGSLAPLEKARGFGMTAREGPVFRGVIPKSGAVQPDESLP
jgi:hypothetical protein